MKDINIKLPPGFESALTAMEKQFVLMRFSGSSIRDIAKKLKKSTRTINNWNKKFAKEIIGIRNSEFCDLPKKVIESKTERLNFLKNEFTRVSNLLKKQKIDVNETFGNYEKFLELFVKLSDLMSSCESDILAIGVKFKDNIELEINLSELGKEETTDNKEINENPPLRKTEENNVFIEPEKETTDNTDFKDDGKQSTTNYNAKTAKKYEVYKKHIDTS
jgi:transposase